ncbi:MAG TPA: PKD domain-containing protein [Bacteroidales bacterium]|nr:PKD domain-containing protein [Bacteroidales bacterium]
MRSVILIHIVLMSLIVISCGEKIPSPTAVISAALDSGVVKFSIETTDAETFEWDFGDGSEVATVENPQHVFPEYGKTYSVILKATGPGGTTICNYEMVIPAATMMQSLTGGVLHGGNRKWRVNRNSKIYVVKPDNSFTVIDEWTADKLNTMGFSNLFLDEYQFFVDGSYAIIPKTDRIITGLQYCLSKSIPNEPPTDLASDNGLTLTRYLQPMSLSYGLNESKDLTLAIVEGQQLKNITFCDVSTISFSRGGFLGIMDWESECLMKEITEKEMVVTLFFSDVPSGEPFRGRINKAFILRFEAV